LIHARIADWFFSTGGELPDGFPVTYCIRKARDLNDGSDDYCDYARSGIDDAISEMSPHELRLWADRIRYDNL